MRLENRNDPPAVERLLPADLRPELGERALVRLALEAVQTVDWALQQLPARPGQEYRPQMMLTLLAYCYAAGIYGSQDIEWAIAHDPTVRYICAHKCPDWLALRRFRRQHRELLKQCLRHLLRQAWLLRCARGAAEFPHGPWWETELDERFAASVQDRLELAVILDRAAVEE